MSQWGCMARLRNLSAISALAVFLMILALHLGAWCEPCRAQSIPSVITSAIPLGGIEKYIGPILPDKGIGSTFRSEVAAAYGISFPQKATLTGSNLGKLDLLRPSVGELDAYPVSYSVYTDLRLWRLGFRAKYTDFTTRSRRVNFGRFDMTGLQLGLDFDFIQLQWLTLGASVDFNLIDPRLRGTFSIPNTANLVTVNLKGDNPHTVGGYARYVPPEILGFPVHVEAFLKFPLTGAKYTHMGAYAVFRPQFYRFDVAAKIGAQKKLLRFETDPISFTGTPAVTQESLKLDMDWNVLSLEMVVYF
jgi:hypothetical protein